MGKKRSPCMGANRFRADNGRTVGRLNIYGEISEQVERGDEVTPGLLLAHLESMGPIDELEVHIFSNGGDVFAGLSIYKMLKDRREPVTAYVEGIAASIATVILCGADRVLMGDTDMLMIHDPMGSSKRGVMNAGQARDLADELERIRAPMVAAYMAKTGRSEEEVLAVMDGVKGNGTWFSAEQAIEFGLADGYTPDAKRPVKAAARIRPGVLSLHGVTADLRRFSGAAKYTSNNPKQQKGVSIPMAKAKKKGFGFLFPRRRAELDMIEMVCPHCGADVLLNPDTAEVALVSVDEDGHVEEVIESEVVARRSSRGFRAQVFTVTCPHCAGQFAWDTDDQAAGDDGEVVLETVEVGEDPEELAAVARRGRVKGKVQRKTAPKAKGLFSKIRAEIAETICPCCNAEVPYDAQGVEIDTDENGVEGYALTCVVCGTDFIEPLADSLPDAIPLDSAVAYRKGIAAERRRMLALDDMAAAAPGCEHMIQAAKRSGASAQVMTRNVFKAMSGNPAVAGQKHRAAIRRDAQAAGINGMTAPGHYSPKTAYVNGVLNKLDDR